MNSRLKKVILFIGDFTSLFLALSMVLSVRYPKIEFNSQLLSHIGPFSFIFVIWLITIYVSGLYDLNLRVKGRRFFRGVMSTTVMASLLSIIYFYINITSSVTPRTNLALFIAFFVVIFYAWRYLHQTISHAVPKTGLAIIGSNQKGLTIAEEIKKNPGAGYQTELIINSEAEFSDLKTQVENGKIKVIVVCDDFSSSGSANNLLSLLQNRISVFSYPDFYELLKGKIPVEAISATWFLENLRENQKNSFNFFKRVCDVVGALATLAISIIFWPLVAIIIKLESKGPVFIKQARLGHQGKTFTIIKFRTMKEEGNDRGITLENDKRITRFGNFLRKTRIDEIPQMINIIKGEMSFIGPRPERPEFAKELENAIPFYNTRLIVKPGISGWDQVSGEYHSPTQEDTLKKLQNDLFYIKNRSLFLDATIILKTIATILSRGGR
jgi:exopolysaccharide biosynthesis polyprenyl glycosylphosphotransferase